MSESREEAAILSISVVVCKYSLEHGLILDRLNKLIALVYIAAPVQIRPRIILTVDIFDHVNARPNARSEHDRTGSVLEWVFACVRYEQVDATSSYELWEIIWNSYVEFHAELIESYTLFCC